MPVSFDFYFGRLGKGLTRLAPSRRALRGFGTQVRKLPHLCVLCKRFFKKRLHTPPIPAAFGCTDKP